MGRRLIGALAMLGAISAVAGGVAGARRGNDAIKPSVFVAPGGSDERSCRARDQACASFGRAYRAARPGELVEVAGGSYPDQEIVADPRKTSRRHVVFRPAKKAVVTLAGLSLGTGENGDGPRHLTIERMRTEFVSRTEQHGVFAGPGTSDVVWAGLDAGSFNLWGVQDFKIRGGDWGPCSIGPDASCSNAKIDAGPDGYATRNVIVDGARFHDFRFGPGCWDGGDCHFECMYVNGSRNVTIRRSKFRDCALYNIFVTLSGPDAARVGHDGLTIENNWFDTPWDESGPTTSQRRRASAVALNWCQNSDLGYRNVRIRFNSFQRNTGFLLDPNPDCRFENVRVVGNLMAWDGCDSRWSYDYNVLSTGLRRGRCSRTDRIAGNAFPYRQAASGPGFDFRLKERWRVAEDLVPASVAGGCARTDVDGRRRTGRRCDAGSSESR